MRERGNSHGRLLASALLFITAVAIRALTWPTVLLSGSEVRTLPFGNDVYYHLRRVAYTLVNFPGTLEFDRYINYPHGARPIWTPAFDAMAALALAPFAGTGANVDFATAERLAMWLPPLLGGATVVVTHRLVLAFFGATTALAAGLLLCVLSGHVWYSQIGFFDHHAAVALMSALLLAAAMQLLDRESRGRPTLFPAIGLGAALGGSLLLWPGSLLHVAVVEAALVIMGMTRSTRTEAIGFAWRVTLSNAVAAAAVLPMLGAGREPTAALWGPMTPAVASGFQPWFFSAIALSWAGCAFAWGRLPGARYPRGRVRVMLGVAVAIAAWSLAAFPELSSGAADAWQWLARSESFQAQVRESVPLLSDGRGGTEISTAVQRLSWFVVFFPVVALWLVMLVRRDRHRAAIFLFVGWSLVLFVATLAQRRFFNSFSVPLAMLMAIFVCWLENLLPPAWSESKRLTRAARGVIVAWSLLLLFPVFLTYRVPVENALGALAGRPAAFTLTRANNARMFETAHWIRNHTPETSGWLSADSRPEYAVLGPWTMGHVVEYVGRRPTVTNAFGDDIGRKNFDLAREYFLAGETEASRIADALGIRYVIASQGYEHLGGEPGLDSMFAAFALYDGTSRSAFPKMTLVARPSLVRHRLLFESLAVPNRPDSVGTFKVFEVVAGARLRGRAAPGARVTARLSIQTNRGRSLVYESAASARESGRFEIPVAYATRGQPGSTAVGATYRIACQGEQRAVSVPETAVQRGLVVPVPPMCGGKPRVRRSTPIAEDTR